MVICGAVDGHLLEMMLYLEFFYCSLILEFVNSYVEGFFWQTAWSTVDSADLLKIELKAWIS